MPNGNLWKNLAAGALGGAMASGDAAAEIKRQAEIDRVGREAADRESQEMARRESLENQRRYQEESERHYALEGNVLEQRRSLQGLEDSIGTVERYLGDMQLDFSEYDRRLSKIEEQLASISAKLDGVAEDLGDKIKSLGAEDLHDKMESLSNDIYKTGVRIDLLSAQSDQIGRHLFRLMPQDPKYKVNMFSPEILFREYLECGHDLTMEAFFLPPKWVQYIETEFIHFNRTTQITTDIKEERPIPPSCLFVCAEPETVPLIVDLLSKARGDSPHCWMFELTNETKPADYAGILTNMNPGDYIVAVDQTLYELDADFRLYFTDAIRHFCIKIVVGDAEGSKPGRAVTLDLPPHCMYFVTGNATSATNVWSGIFPRQVVIANIVPTFCIARLGQIARNCGIQLSYQMVRELNRCLRDDNDYVPDEVMLTLCKNHLAWIEEWKKGGLGGDELARRLHMTSDLLSNRVRI